MIARDYNWKVLPSDGESTNGYRSIVVHVFIDMTKRTPFPFNRNGVESRAKLAAFWLAIHLVKKISSPLTATDLLLVKETHHVGKTIIRKVAFCWDPPPCCGHSMYIKVAGSNTISLR
jgi:hypothetical protein